MLLLPYFYWLISTIYWQNFLIPMITYQLNVREELSNLSWTHLIENVNHTEILCSETMQCVAVYKEFDQNVREEHHVQDGPTGVITYKTEQHLPNMICEFLGSIYGMISWKTIVTFNKSTIYSYHFKISAKKGWSVLRSLMSYQTG